MGDPVLFMNWPAIRASIAPDGLRDQYPVEKVFVWYHGDAEWGEQRWSPIGCRFPEYSVLDTLATRRVELGLNADDNDEDENERQQPPADGVVRAPSAVNAEAGSPGEAFAQREPSSAGNSTEPATRHEAQPARDVVQGFASHGKADKLYRRRASSDMSISSDDDNEASRNAPEPPEDSTVHCEHCGQDHLSDQHGEQLLSHGRNSQEPGEEETESYKDFQSATPDSFTDFLEDISVTTDSESSDDSSPTAVVRKAQKLKEEAEVILQESQQINQLAQALLSAGRSPIVDAEAEDRGANSNATRQSSFTAALAAVEEAMEAMVEDVRQVVQPTCEQSEEPLPEEQSRRSPEPPQVPMLSFRAREAVCHRLGIPWELNMLQIYERGQPVYIVGPVQPLPFQLIVSVGVVVSVDPVPHVYQVMYDAVHEHKAPSTPYNLWQTQTVRASELFPRHHGKNSGFVVSMVEDDPTQRIGQPTQTKHVTPAISSVANRGVILRALGLPDHHFRHTTPRFEIGQPVYVSRGQDSLRHAFRFDPGTIIAIHHGQGPRFHGGYVVKVESFDQPAVTFAAHIEGYELPFDPEEIYDRRMYCGAIWIQAAFPVPEPSPHVETDQLVFYAEPLWQYLCQRYQYETPQELCSALYDMTFERLEEISSHLQQLCVVGRFKDSEVRLGRLSIHAESARNQPKGGAYSGTVAAFFTEHRAELRHPHWPVIFHWSREECAGTRWDPIGKWPLETLSVVWPKTLCTKEKQKRIAATEFAMQHYSARNLGDVCRRLSSMAECMRFEQVLRQRRVAGTFNGLTFYFADFQLQLDPNAFDCQGPIPSTSSVAHYLHLHSQDVPHGGIVLLNRAHLAEEARDPLGTWPLEMLTVMR